MKALLYIGLILGASGSVSAAEIYRWVDANGVVNYTQLAPEGTKVERIETRAGGAHVVADAPPPVPAAVPAPESDLTATQQKMLENLRAAEQARQDEIAKIRADNCEKSRNVLSRLTAKEHIRVQDASGQQRMMPEEERQQRIRDAQMGIATNCDAA